jgi:hypothetical protein
MDAPKPKPRFLLATKLLGFVLPVAAALTLLVLLFGGGIKQIGNLSDLSAFVLELPARTVYAIAIIGSASVIMHATATDLGNGKRQTLIDQAVAGKGGALLVLFGETLAWMGWALIFSHIYLQGAV